MTMLLKFYSPGMELTPGLFLPTKAKHQSCWLKALKRAGIENLVNLME